MKLIILVIISRLADMYTTYIGIENGGVELMPFNNLLISKSIYLYFVWNIFLTFIYVFLLEVLGTKICKFMVWVLIIISFLASIINTISFYNNL